MQKYPHAFSAWGYTFLQNGRCSGKLKLDTEGVILDSPCYTSKQEKILSVQRCSINEQEAYHETHKRRTTRHWTTNLQ